MRHQLERRRARNGKGISNQMVRYDFNEFLDDTKTTTAGLTSATTGDVGRRRAATTTAMNRMTSEQALSSRTAGFDLKVRPGIERKNPRDNTSTEVPLPLVPAPTCPPVAR